MNTTIFHFSGTGNSLKVAMDLAKALGETELVPLARATAAQLSPRTDIAGIVFPVYAWGPPPVVVRFLSRVKIEPDTYVFAVCTCASSAGGTLGNVQAHLRNRDITLSSGFVVPMPSNYIVWGNAPAEAKQQQMFSRAEARVAEIATVIRAQEVRDVEAGNWLARGFSGMAHRASIRAFAGMDRKFTVSETCNGCGVCERVCQVGNIKLTDGRPEWLHRCEQCLACLQWCPQEAINVGTKTRGRKRYHHPAIRATDLM